MKKMKTTLAIAIALATGVGTSVFAQTKVDTITVNLTGTEQSSVSQTTANNAGDWLEIDPISGAYTGPKYYKTSTTKVTQQSILKYIGYVLHGNALFYSSKANLMLVQGELSGFFDITPDLASSTANFTTWDITSSKYVTPGDYPGLDGTFDSFDGDLNTQIANAQDSTFVTLANGRHFQLNPDGYGTGPTPTSSEVNAYPVGHMQPWGQIFVQDPGQSGYSASDPYCENVTYFFALSVEECYDCFYMNSFVSTATFKTVKNVGIGPVCCNAGSELEGTGKDSYYLTLSFDNTQNNPFLYPLAANTFVGVVGIKALAHGGIAGDAIVPDAITYFSSIETAISTDVPYEARFTLNGILTYTWNLKKISTSDLTPDFLGTATYNCSGYGFIGLFCNLLTGSATFTERATTAACCTDENDGDGWSDWWYGPGAEYVAADNDVGFDTAYDVDFAAFTPGVDQAPLTPWNVSTSLTFHENFDYTYPWMITYPSGWLSPAIVISPFGDQYQTEPEE